jgi:peptidoglycan-associated lipoprotein
MIEMRFLRGPLVVVAAATLLGGCATTGALKRAKEETQAALDRQQAQLTAEKSEREAQDAALSKELGIVRGDVQALRKELTDMKADFNAKIQMVEAGMQFAFPVNFAFNDATIRPEDRAALDRFAKVVRKYYTGSKVTIEGFADPAGTSQYNLSLSARRAGSVRDYLVSQGLIANELNAVGYGETRLVTPGASHDQPGAELNRRVVFVVETKAQQGVAMTKQPQRARMSGAQGGR